MGHLLVSTMKTYCLHIVLNINNIQYLMATTNDPYAVTFKGFGVGAFMEV